METFNNLNKKEKIALILGSSPIILLILIGFSIALINNNFGNRECLNKRKFLEFDCHGIVTEKGRDKKNHNYAYIVVKDINNNEEKVFLPFSTDEIWEKIQKNDIIEKNMNDTFMLVTRDTVTFEINPDFDCKEGDFFLSP